MQEVLQHVNMVEGVIGSAVFSQKGDVLSHAFPALIDTVSLKKAAGLTLECAHGLQISQSLDILDMRYNDGRIILKRLPSAMLFLLCTKSINLQVLSITLNLAAKKLEAQMPPEASVAQPSDTTAGPAKLTDSDGILRLRISHLANKQASASFDSLGMIAISQPTSQYINDFYKAGFKKLTLINTVAGTNGSFPVMVMKDMDPQYDGTIVVGPGIEKKLRVSEGDKVEVKL
ncbi:MAG: roadblock/LC7 domain-containing protein [Deltaproteobacteria bacterium]|nr:roadblock/LC7 domain-containing protein [Deltaproteobacteria bacterium]